MKCDWCDDVATLFATGPDEEILACRTHHSRYVWGRKNLTTVNIDPDFQLPPLETKTQ